MKKDAEKLEPGDDGGERNCGQEYNRESQKEKVTLSDYPQNQASPKLLHSSISM